MKYILLIQCLTTLLMITNSSSSTDKIDAVVLTTAKDTRAFVKSIESGLKHLIDVDKFYVVTPHVEDLKVHLVNIVSPRIILVDESIFPFSGENISQVMFETVREKGIYPMTGSSQFEKGVWARIGWYLQQLLKLYAGRVIGLGDFVLLDSDLVWFKDIKFFNDTSDSKVSVLSSTSSVATISNPPYSGRRYNYVTSSQYHGAYLAILERIAGVPFLANQPVHRSGVCHHMVVVQSVMDDLIRRAEEIHGLPFWQVLLNISALEMTCKAPRAGICGGGSTLSEYELYFNFARSIYPDSVNLRPLLWANGPAPGLQFWPSREDELISDGFKSSWLGHRQSEVVAVLEQQMLADKAQGYDYVGYHNYAKRRYYEVVGVDLTEMCKTHPVPQNTTCSWRGWNEAERPANDWFAGCGCYMAQNAAGP